MRLAEAAQERMREQYRDGMSAGVLETLDQLEGRSRLVPDGGYRGTMPDELLAWIAAVRRRVESDA